MLLLAFIYTLRHSESCQKKVKHFEERKKKREYKSSIATLSQGELVLFLPKGGSLMASDNTKVISVRIPNLFTRV